jgi:hypothetical protein
MYGSRSATTAAHAAKPSALLAVCSAGGCFVADLSSWSRLAPPHVSADRAIACILCRGRRQVESNSECAASIGQRCQTLRRFTARNVVEQRRGPSYRPARATAAALILHNRCYVTLIGRWSEQVGLMQSVAHPLRWLTMKFVRSSRLPRGRTPRW